MQFRRFSVLVVLILGSTLALGQAQVREAGGRNQPVAQAPANNDLMVSMYNQVEALQQEVQTLRGVVEEQGYQLKRLQTEQRDRYLDIDRRLSGLAPASPLPGVIPGVNAAGTPVPPAGAVVATSASPQGQTTSLNPASDNNVLAEATPQLSTFPAVVTTPQNTVIGSPQDEQALYRTALNLLLEESKYQESIAMFQSYIGGYPQGRLLTNALYWQGEAYLLANGFTEARDVFMRLLNEYPLDAKAAGAQLKLGMAYKQMGDAINAAESWRGIKVRFPESINEIRLAEEYLKGL